MAEYMGHSYKQEEYFGEELELGKQVKVKIKYK